MSTFPFEKDDTKKYSCFVCGVQFEDFDLFKGHIFEKHDEGREFIVCPLARCGAPVRDMKSHFKAKHPSEQLPKTGQMRAMVWKDQVGQKGKLKTRKPKFREGYLMSNKMGKEVHYRSGMECNFYECLEADKTVIKYDVEPFTVKYSFQGDTHDYHPDLSVVFDDGRVEVWEIKPAKQTTLDKNKAKWAACQSHCEARGWEFVVVTEVGLGKLKNKIDQQYR